MSASRNERANAATRAAAAADYRRMDGEAALIRLVRESDPREASLLDQTQMIVHGAIADVYTLIQQVRGTANWPLADDLRRRLERLDAQVYDLVRRDITENRLHELALATVSAGAEKSETPKR